MGQAQRDHSLPQIAMDGHRWVTNRHRHEILYRAQPHYLGTPGFYKVCKGISRVSAHLKDATALPASVPSLRSSSALVCLLE